MNLTLGNMKLGHFYRFFLKFIKSNKILRQDLVLLYYIECVYMPFGGMLIQ